MLFVRFTILGDLVLERAVSRFADSVKDFSPVWERIRDDFHRIEEEQFETEGGRSGAPWQHLSRVTQSPGGRRHISYEEWKHKHFPGAKILYRTGAMWGQFVTGVGMTTEISPMRLLIQPNIPYAIYHQQGTSKMPQRRVVNLTEADKMGWMKMIKDFAFWKANEAGLR